MLWQTKADAKAKVKWELRARPRIASRLLEEQLALARRILNPNVPSSDDLAGQIMRLASVTLELHRQLSNGTPFPSLWLAPLSIVGEQTEGGAKNSS
jgi:hypothetical protein